MPVLVVSSLTRQRPPKTCHYVSSSGSVSACWKHQPPAAATLLVAGCEQAHVDSSGAWLAQALSVVLLDSSQPGLAPRLELRSASGLYVAVPALIVPVDCSTTTTAQPAKNHLASELPDSHRDLFCYLLSSLPARPASSHVESKQASCGHTSAKMSGKLTPQPAPSSITGDGRVANALGRQRRFRPPHHHLLRAGQAVPGRYVITLS